MKNFLNTHTTSITRFIGSTGFIVMSILQFHRGVGGYGAFLISLVCLFEGIKCFRQEYAGKVPMNNNSAKDVFVALSEMLILIIVDCFFH